MSFEEDPAKFIASEASVSDKIRALAAAGYPRAEIARMLGKRYQHVRNVLEADRVKAGPSADVSASRSEIESLPDGGLRVGDLFKLPIDAEGRVRLPSRVIEAYGLYKGGVVVARLEGDLFILMSPKESWRRAKAEIPAWKPGEPMWSEELIADRRREQAAEDENG